MSKSADAFRTISEVADWLETPAHVLRFWESKFSQVKPVKRAGGRRYYRPADMKLLGGIKKLLHDDGMTIKGVQKMLREQGVADIASLSQPLGDAADDVVIERATGAVSTAEDATGATSPTTAPSDGPKPEARPEPEPETEPETEPEVPLTFSRHAAQQASETDAKADPEPEVDPSAPEPEAADDLAPTLPSFLTHREDAAASPGAEPEQAPSEPEKPKPATVNVPEDPDDTIEADPGVLGRIARLPRRLTPDAAAKLEPLLVRLRAASGATPKD